MSRRVFFIECSGSIWLDVVRAGAERHGWIPLYWTAHHGDEAAIRAAFPDVVFHAGADAARGRPAPGLALRPATLGTDLLRTLADDETIALHMMDRMDAGGDFLHEERRRHWHDLLRYWSAVIDHFRPDAIVFPVAPHIVFDYAVYALARARGIPTLMFERLGLPGFVFPIAAIEAYPAGFHARSFSPLSPPFAAYLKASSEGGKAAVPANFQRKLGRFGMEGRQTPPLWRVCYDEAWRLAYLVKTNGLKPIPNTYLKRSGHAPSAPGPNALRMAAVRLRAMARKRRLRAMWDRLATAPLAGEPYVLLALHYQPERATVPMGDLLGDQTLIVDMLARHLPPGWMLYVKEHPWQLQPVSRPETQRSPDFYERIARHDNVRLMPAATGTASLIEDARAVATVTGSVGWQALGRGKPALVFGAAWYRAAPGAYRIREGRDLEAALSDIQGGAEIDPDALGRFLAAIQDVCVPGVLEPAVEAVDTAQSREWASGMADALAGEWAARAVTAAEPVASARGSD